MGWQHAKRIVASGLEGGPRRTTRRRLIRDPTNRLLRLLSKSQCPCHGSNPSRRLHPAPFSERCVIRAEQSARALHSTIWRLDGQMDCRAVLYLRRGAPQRWQRLCVSSAGPAPPTAKGSAPPPGGARAWRTFSRPPVWRAKKCRPRRSPKAGSSRLMRFISRLRPFRGLRRTC